MSDYRLSFTAQEIDAKLQTVDKAVLCIQQSLTDEEKAQVKANLGLLDESVTITPVQYSYDGDQSGEKTWVQGASGENVFVKVADIPDGQLSLSGGEIRVVTPANSWLDYSITITDEMLNETVNISGVDISAKVNGLTQIFYQHELDESPCTVLFVCTRAGQYDMAFNGWMAIIAVQEPGIYFFDNRSYGGAKYASTLECNLIISADDEEDITENPTKYTGNDIQLFTRGICIGDSITEGVFNHSDGEIVIKKYSYPSALHRMTNIEIVNAGIAGLTSETWYQASLNSSTQYGRWVDNEWVWSESPTDTGSSIVSTSLDYSNFDFAIIHLGINDIGMMGTASLETTINKFETNINNIITKLKTSSSGIKVFLATIIPCYAVRGNTIYEALNEKIRSIAAATDDVYLIDLNNYSECIDGSPYEHQHLTALGYHKMASEIASLVSYIINQNLTDFNAVQFTGTSYTM